MDYWDKRDRLRRRKWQPTPVFLPGESRGQRSLSMGSHRVGHDRSDSAGVRARAGEGNGSPRQRSCLESARDGGALWAAVCGISQSQTRLKQFSGSRGRRANSSFSLRHSREKIEDPGHQGHRSTFAERRHPITQGLLPELSLPCVRSSICLLQEPPPQGTSGDLGRERRKWIA